MRETILRVVLVCPGFQVCGVGQIHLGLGHLLHRHYPIERVFHRADEMATLQHGRLHRALV